MRYIKQFDGVRFIAIALVLIQHFAYSIGHRISAGYFGVELFFVLSGFLITRIIYDSRGSLGAIYKKFIGRRALRIFPIYYLVIGTMYLAGDAWAGKYILPLATYTFNYTIAGHGLKGMPFIHVWSLCVEEQFYIIWPFIILLLRKRFTWLIGVLAAIVLAGWIQMVFMVLPMSAGYTNMSLFPRAYALALGGLAALLCEKNGSPHAWFKHKWIEVGSLITLCLSLTIPSRSIYVIAPTIATFWMAKIYYNSVQLHYINRFLQLEWAMYLGRISYGIYLYHIPVSVYFTKYIFNPYIWSKINFKALGPLAGIQHQVWVVKLFLYTILSISVAHLSFRFIEKPLLRLKDKWFA